MKPGQQLVSQMFTVAGLQWYLSVFPSGYGSASGTHLSVFLNCESTVEERKKMQGYEFKVVVQAALGAANAKGVFVKQGPEVEANNWCAQRGGGRLLAPRRRLPCAEARAD